jgi:hypothetical protein
MHISMQEQKNRNFMHIHALVSLFRIYCFTIRHATYISLLDCKLFCPLLMTNNVMIGCFNENSFPVTSILELGVILSFSSLFFIQHERKKNKKWNRTSEFFLPVSVEMFL